MNPVIRQVLEAVRDDRVTPGTRHTARHLLDREERLKALAAARSCTTTETVAKTPIASVEYHQKYRRAEDEERENVSRVTWSKVLDRTTVDHRGHFACEGCHVSPGGRDGLEPHHLELGAGGRRDAPEVVMALCAGCHRLDPRSAHRTPRLFAQTVVIPWANAHGYALPHRKEYRT